MIQLNDIGRLQQQIWACGDFSMIATGYTMVGELLCEALDLRAGQKVLDVATGSGNAALAAARRWCDVIGIDFVSDLLARARERATCERLTAEFRLGTAEDLPFPDATFDVVLSTFGAMFAPDQPRAAGELLRVCRRGGKIGMANWLPDGFLADILGASARRAPRPPGLPSPLAWGREAPLRELFGDAISSLQLVQRTVPIRFRSVDHWLDFHLSYLGPARHTMESMDQAGQARLAEDLRRVVEHHNQSGDATVLVHAAYLEVVATRA